MYTIHTVKKHAVGMWRSTSSIETTTIVHTNIIEAIVITLLCLCTALKIVV